MWNGREPLSGIPCSGVELAKIPSRPGEPSVPVGADRGENTMGLFATADFLGCLLHWETGHKLNWKFSLSPTFL